MGKRVGSGSNNRATTGFVLGLDVGVASVGWCVTQVDRDENPADLVAMGTHLFEPGTDGSDLDRERGQDSSKNLARRMARQMRRSIWRRARRKRKLLLLLIEHGLLPKPTAVLRTPQEIDAYMKSVDAELRRGLPHGTGHREQQTLFYRLRHRAATEEVTATQFGRALYHLAQRRGFQSNRRADAKAKQDEDRSEIKKSIGELQAAIDKHIPALLGSYLASLDPDEQRLRGRWTARSMYTQEFDAMWGRQGSRFGLSKAACDQIRQAIFWQRPLRSAANLVGRCSLIPEERRCPIAHRDFQRFRVLQAANHLTIAPPNAAVRPLVEEEREALLRALMTEGDRTFARVRTLLRLPKGTSFNLERGDETKIVGHRTDEKLREVFGLAFDKISEEERHRIVEDLRSFRLPEALDRRGRKRWGLSPDKAALFSAIALEEGYAPLSLAAIRRLLPAMEKGMPYATARKEMFPESFRSGEPMEKLPPVLDQSDAPRNPAVIRAMTEVRKLVNAIVDRYGKPQLIRVELARDLKNPPKARERLSKRNRERQKEREHAKARILKEIPAARPSRDDIDKVLLADECGWVCPYTGKTMGWESLVGRTPQFDIEHIWPRSRSLDDSWLNKTLCYHEENRARKQGRTPREAYRGEQLEAILDRVRRFKADPVMREIKLQRFTAEEIAPEFTNRHLSDTRYIARATADYLGLLYGGRADEHSVQRVQVTTGGLTAWLRSGWGLNTILGETGEKNRADHRHHAIDAAVVALSSPRSVQILARAAEAADKAHQARAFREIEEPWRGFRKRVEEMVESIVVSHRQSRRVSGELHEETIYKRSAGGETTTRKALANLSLAEIVSETAIKDRRVRGAVRELLKRSGLDPEKKADEKKISALLADSPITLPGHEGSKVRVRHVTVATNKQVRSIGTSHPKLVKTGSNHHAVVYAEPSRKGGEEWRYDVVSTFDVFSRLAAQRSYFRKAVEESVSSEADRRLILASGDSLDERLRMLRDAARRAAVLAHPVVDQSRPEGQRFLFSLAIGDHLKMRDPKNASAVRVWRVRAISEGEIKVVEIANNDPDAVSGKTRTRITGSGDRLRELEATKVEITPLGELRPASG